MTRSTTGPATRYLTAPNMVYVAGRSPRPAATTRSPAMRPVHIEFWGGPFDGRVDRVLSGPHGQPPAWCLLTFQPSRSALDPGPAPAEEGHRYVRDDPPRPDRPWRYRWEGGSASWPC